MLTWLIQPNKTEKEILKLCFNDGQMIICDWPGESSEED